MNRKVVTHRKAIVAVIVLLIGGLGLLAADFSSGQPRKVQGAITEAGSPTNLLDGVTVSLRDAHGQKAQLVFITGADGAYAFTPTPGFYRVTVGKAGFFDNETEVFRFDNTANLIKDLEMERMPDASLTLTVHVEDTVAGAIDNAIVDLFNVTMAQVVATNLTNATGDTTFPVWAGDFELRVDKEGFEREVMPITITMSAMTTVVMDAGIDLVGIARKPDGTFVSAGLVAFLYNTDGATPDTKRLLVADVSGSSYTFFAYAGTFILIVDADGKAANITTIVVSASDRIDRTLDPSPEERVDTTIQYADGDWNTLHLWRNLSFNDDSTFPGLPFASVRNLRLQIDLALGDGDGSLDATEREAFRTFLVEAGPKQVDTEDFFTTNSEAHRSDLVGPVTDYTVSFATFDLVVGPVKVTSLANYTAIDPSIAANQARYFVNITAPHDTDAEVQVNTTYTIQVVPTYERETETITGSAEIQRYVRIVIDPLVAAGNFRVDMEVARAVAGTARVLVVAPPDRFTETNVSVDNYTAIIPTNESMTFSAEESTDPNSPDGRVNPDSNFTWTFTNATTPQVESAFGIRPNVTFSVMGNYSGNLTIVEVGGNVTFRNFTLHVDGILPIALLENGITGLGIDANNTTISIEKGQMVEFFAGNSTDRVHDDMVGVVGAYRWDFDGDAVVDATGRRVDWIFETPGEFTVNLTVVDQAGHEGLNATMFVTVAAPTAPTAPWNLVATAVGPMVDLTWQAPLSDGSSPVTNYRVYRGTAPAPAMKTLLANVGTSLSYVDTTGVAGQTYYYEVSAVNAIGEGPRSNEASATPVAPDTTKPTVSITSPADGATLNSTSVVVLGTASDNGAVEMVELSLDGTNYVLATGTTSWSGTVTLTEGPNTIFARATDTAGNTAAVSVAVTVDTVSPTISITSPADGSALASPSVMVFGTASDDVALDKVEGSTDGMNWVLATGTMSWLFILNLTEGDHTVFARATDKSGNTATASIAVTVDTVAPETALSPAGTLGESGWHTSTVTVTLTASDATSSVTSLAYRIDDDAWLEYAGPFTVEGDGIHTVEYYSTDVAGNAEAVKRLDVKIDSTLPTLSVSSPSSGAFLGMGDIEVTWSASDATSGIDHFEVSLDGGTPVVLPATATSHTFPGVADGSHTVTITAFDVAGNAVVLSVDLTVDTNILSLTGPYGSGPLIGISVGIIAAAVAAALLLWRRRAGGKRKE